MTGVKLTVSGMDNLKRELKEMAEATKALDGTIATLEVNPNDPQSIDRAVREMKCAVDRKLSRYSSNRMVKDLAAKSKEMFEKQLREDAKEKASS